MKVHLLDMGRTKYGDCLLLQEEQHTILIDGGHPGDTASIRRQLSTLLGQRPPFHIDLLIVTHCHQDHIGCLPDLIDLGVIVPRVALVADEQLGWGKTDGVDGMDTSSLPAMQKTLFLALQEEERADLRDDELEQFFFDAVRLEDTYIQMLETLQDKGCQIVRYGRHTEEELRAVEEAGAPFKLKILGPTQEHLAICAEAIANTLGGGRDAILEDIMADASPGNLAGIYRDLARRFERDSVAARFSADRPGIGAAKNNQSLVLSVQAPEQEGSWKALLAGDMQFAKAEVPGLEESMEQLLETINENGPYAFIKLTHHSSYNGLDDDILDDWHEETKLFAHTGGWNDPTHPDGGVLRILEDRAEDLVFARTDRNGLISVAWEDGDLGMDISRGDFNDFSLNEKADEVPIAQPVTPQSPTAATIIPPEQPLPPTETTANNTVEVIARVPHLETRVTITIEVDPGKKKLSEPRIDAQPVNVALTDNRFAGLLMVTSWKALHRNIKDAAYTVKSFLQQVGAEVLEVPEGSLSSAEAIASVIKERLSAKNFKGAVILGGYDIIPAHKLDALLPELRAELKTKKRLNRDADDFYVWSDDLYVDINGDGYPDLPISRIPDGKDEELMMKALTAPRFSVKSRFGVRNLARPFAQGVFKDIPGEINEMQISETFSPQDVAPDSALGAVYYMLHGSDRDGTRFWGETVDEEEYEAFSIENIPASAPGTVVFTGCCWGALAAEPTAFRKTTSTPMRPRTPEQSIALKYLKAGALAFVGSTGAHYSPREEPYDYHGKPLHDHFWRGIREGKAPALALFEAKLRYKEEYPHGETTPFSKAVELKTFRQFTCLGLGW